MDAPGEPVDADLLAALEHGAPPLPQTLAPGEWAVAAAGVWDDLASIVVLHREEDGVLLDDTHVLARDDSGAWALTGASSGSAMPEWVLERPAGQAPHWSGAHVQVLMGQVAAVPAHVGARWAADVTVMVSRAVRQVELVHDQRRLVLDVPASGLVTAPVPVRSAREEVRVRALDAAGSVLGEEVYPPLTETDREWPDPALWADEP